MEVVGVKPVLFREDATNFESNGIGVLHDALTCTVFEARNGSFDLELEYPAYGEWASEIDYERLVLAKPNDEDGPHAFRIYEIDKDLDDAIIFVRATSITDDLRGNLIMNVSVEDVTPQVALNTIKSNLIEPTTFDFISDIETKSASQWTRINTLQAIVGVESSLLDLYGGEIKRNNDTIYLYSRRGTDKVTVIRPGKNIDGFNMSVSTKGLVTKIVPTYTYTFEGMPVYELVDGPGGTKVKQEKYSDEEPVKRE